MDLRITQVQPPVLVNMAAVQRSNFDFDAVRQQARQRFTTAAFDLQPVVYKACSLKTGWLIRRHSAASREHPELFCGCAELSSTHPIGRKRAINVRFEDTSPRARRRSLSSAIVEADLHSTEGGDHPRRTHLSKLTAVLPSPLQAMAVSAKRTVNAPFRPRAAHGCGGIETPKRTLNV